VAIPDCCTIRETRTKHTFSDKTTVWGAHYIIKISENTEQRIIIIQMHSTQHPQIDQSHYNIPSFLLSRSNPTRMA